MNFTNIFSNINPKEVLQYLPDAVFVIESDGKIVWVNDKASIIFEAKANLLKGLYFDEVVSNGLALAEKSYSKRNSVVTGAFTPEGKEFFIEMNVKKFVEQYFVTIRDVTAMTNVLTIAERTGRLNKEKNVMFVKLSNEIKSPIQSIMGFSQALIDGLGGEITDKQNKYVKIINKNATELLYFMDKFLEFAQAESSLFSTESQTFDLINTIQLVLKNNENIINDKNLTINIDFENLSKKTIYSDESAIKRILQNILETSIKLTDVGSITIKADNPEMEIVEKCGAKIVSPAESQSYIRIAISDTGMGLAESELEGIFEPYTQLDKSNKKTIVRSITLGIAYTILKRMGGAIWVESEVMKGSTFYIIIPLEKEI
ncbi:TPA: PAS domain-containing sensor histidine kinase [Candidatus Gastranaerophilales bacterium HUM_20]|nr:two-component system sensory histidine kinase [Clostridium sp. CAG:729]DAB22855.1 MAG TPA: PAS domain-containing sensor histidine kinase [Candidatus Gastranaerophilales bacterium HUM_20]